MIKIEIIHSHLDMILAYLTSPRSKVLLGDKIDLHLLLVIPTFEM